MKVRLKKERLEHYLAVRNLNYNAFARTSGLTRSHLSQIVNGRRAPSASVRDKILNAVAQREPGVKFQDLFELLDDEGNVTTSDDPFFRGADS